MKLIIDIPEELAKEGRWYTDKQICTVINAVQNGIPLDKIRAEIMKLQTYKMFGGEDTVYVEHEDVLAIIDKYKAESEPQERSGER